MHLKVLARIERVFVGAVIAWFFAPLALGLYFHFRLQPAPGTAWLRNTTLAGVQKHVPGVPYTGHHLLKATYQASLAQKFDTHFYGRELLIRTINEIYLRCLHVSPVDFLVGPHLALDEKVYAQEYCQWRPPHPQFHRPLVEDMQRFQDICARRGIAFALVVTPSKASIYPEWLPFGWAHLYQPGPRYYDDLIPLLREAGIHYVDGHVITAQLKQTSPVSVFPLGGVHWGDRAALATTNALINTLAAQGLPIQPLRDVSFQQSTIPHGQDDDLARALNILSPLRYPVEAATVHRQAPSVPGRPSLVTVSGSFGLKLINFLDASHQFSEIDCYNYYKVSKMQLSDGAETIISEPTAPVDFASEIYAANAIVFELNETAMPEARHLVAFLHDALAAAPAPGAAPVPFRFEGRMKYEWGDSISLTTTDFLPENAAKYHPDRLNNLPGFTAPGDIGAFTDGELASIHFFAPPPPPAGVVLEIDAKPFLAPPRLTHQQVDVVVNGHAIGGWDWGEMTFAHKTLPVPRAFLDDGDVTVEFHIAHPAAPADFGLNADARRLGLLIQRVQLHPVDLAPARYVGFPAGCP